MRLESNTTFIPHMRLMYPDRGGVVMDVYPNEMACAIQEGNATNKEGTEDHRYQVILIPRGNDLCSFWTDLGPAKNFTMEVDGEVYPVPSYHQIVLMEHSVAECMYMAEHGRNDDFAIRLLHEQTNESTLFDDYARLIEEDMYLVRNRSSFGRYQKIERNSYSYEGARAQAERLQNGY